MQTERRMSQAPGRFSLLPLEITLSILELAGRESWPWLWRTSLGMQKLLELLRRGRPSPWFQGITPPCVTSPHVLNWILKKAKLRKKLGRVLVMLLNSSPTPERKRLLNLYLARGWDPSLGWENWLLAAIRAGDRNFFWVWKLSRGRIRKREFYYLALLEAVRGENLEFLKEIIGMFEMKIDFSQLNKIIQEGERLTSPHLEVLLQLRAEKYLYPAP